jgi:hypothetical protein
MAMRGSTYILEGRESELAQHNGHEVEVTGTLMSATSGSGSSTAGTTGSTGASGAPAPGSTSSPGSTSTPGASGTTASGTTAPSGGSSMASQHLQVTSVRMIASTCTQ